MLQMNTYKVWPESFHPCNRKNRDIYWKRSKMQETLYMEEWCLSPLQTRYTGTSNSSPGITSTIQNTLQNPLMEAPSASASYFPEYHGWSAISSLSEMILVWGKARSHRTPNLGCRWAESPGSLDVFLQIVAWNVMNKQSCYCDESAND